MGKFLRGTLMVLCVVSGLIMANATARGAPMAFGMGHVGGSVPDYLRDQVNPKLDLFLHVAFTVGFFLVAVRSWLNLRKTSDTSNIEP